MRQTGQRHIMEQRAGICGLGSAVERSSWELRTSGFLRGCVGSQLSCQVGDKQASREEEKPWPRVRKAKARHARRNLESQRVGELDQAQKVKDLEYQDHGGYRSHFT